MAISTGFRFDISIVPSPQIFMEEQLALAVDIRSFREPLKRAIQGVLAPGFQHNFEVGGRPPWEPLAESTITRKINKGSRYPEKILVDSGKLQKVAGQLNIWEINGIQGEAHVAQLPGAEYGKFHQSGTYKMPAREFLTFDAKDEDEIELVFDVWVRERFRRRGWTGGGAGSGGALGALAGLAGVGAIGVISGIGGAGAIGAIGASAFTSSLGA